MKNKNRLFEHFINEEWYTEHYSYFEIEYGDTQQMIKELKVILQEYGIFLYEEKNEDDTHVLMISNRRLPKSKRAKKK